MTKYHGGFDSRDTVAQEFDEGTWTPKRWIKDAVFTANPSFPTDEEIIYASYDRQDYEGYASVLFEQGGCLYEVHASHCSCYGLEDQWKPEATTWEAIAMRKDHYYAFPPEIITMAKEKISAAGAGSAPTASKESQ